MKYDSYWWMQLIEELNNSKICDIFASLGNVSFEVLGEKTSRTIIHWDKRGKAKVIKDTTNLTATFSATAIDWDDFVANKFNAGQGVLLGRIKFKGNFTKTIKYLSAFNKLSSFGQLINKHNKNGESGY